MQSLRLLHSTGCNCAKLLRRRPTFLHDVLIRPRSVHVQARLSEHLLTRSVLDIHEINNEGALKLCASFSTTALRKRSDQKSVTQRRQQEFRPVSAAAAQDNSTVVRKAAEGSRVGPIRPRENIYTLPNFLTVTRLIAAPITGYMILHNEFAWATGLLLYAGVTDFVDGWIARRWKLQTVVGSIIDPLADKGLMTILTVCLAVQGTLPVWLATTILGRDISLAIAAVYYRFASLPAPKTFLRYWDFSLPSAEVHPTGISKANTFLQLVLIGTLTALPVAGPTVSIWLTNMNAGVDLPTLVTAAQYIVVSTTIWSGASYLYTRKAVKILGEGSPERKRRILVRGRSILGASFLACLAIGIYLEAR